MTNAEKFKNVFGLYATELWAMPEKEFLEWLNVEIQPERPKGEWILITDNNGQHFTCNRCGTWRYHQGQAFCSHCGADMRKPTTIPKEIIDGVLGYDD